MKLLRFMTAEYGKDFLDDVGYNPLKNSLEVNLLAPYVTAKRLDSISEKALQKNFVEDVKYDKDLVALMNSNVKRLGGLDLGHQRPVCTYRHVTNKQLDTTGRVCQTFFD